MRLGLLGYYQHNNVGDERILAAVEQMFAGHTLVVTGSYAEAEQRLDELNACDFMLFGGGGLICPNSNYAALLFKKVTTRLGCIGLGIEFRDTTNNELVTVLEDKAEFMWVRDITSAKLLNRPTIIGSDLTFLNPYPKIIPTANDVCGVNLRKWPMEWDIARCKELLIGNFSDLVCLLFTLPGAAGECDIATFHGLNLEGSIATSLPILYPQCRYIVGMRYHSIVFALQSGLPFLSLAYWPKCSRFCAEAGLNDCVVDLSDIEALEAKILMLKENYEELRQKILDYREISIASTLSAVSTVKGLMGI